jgi:hypothetical protein
MIAAANAAGLKPYVVSPSKRENQYAGLRDYYTLCDLDQLNKADELEERTCLIMTDVDYFVDMNQVLCLGYPVLAYTFQPETVGGLVKNGYFTIKDDIVHYRVSGGKDVKHQIWDYNQDTVYAVHGWPPWVVELMRFTGIIRDAGVMAVNVDQFAMSQHRRIVSLVPFASVPLLLRGEDMGQPLTRASYSDGPFNVLVTLSTGVPQISFCQQDALGSVEMPLDEFEAAVVAHKIAINKNLSDTQRRSGLPGKQAVILHEYLQYKTRVEYHVVHAAGQLAKHYTCLTADVSDEIRKTYARIYAAPALSAEAKYPTECHANDRVAIQERVLKPSARANAKLKVKPRWYMYLRDFIKEIVPDEKAGTGVPVTVDEVITRQDKPLQRVRNAARLMDTHETFMVRSMQKREAYSTENAPRNISTVPTMHTLRLSGFTYGFKTDILSHQHWYVPGSTPAQVADIVMDFCERNRVFGVVETDFSKFDGTITQWVQIHLEHAVMLRWVHKDHYSELEELLRSELHAKGVTKHGVKYNTEGTRLSGSPRTTDSNTLVNAFSDYKVHRDRGMSHAEAFKEIGPKYGDDALVSGRCSDEEIIAGANDLGFTVKIENRAKSGRVSFLSRVFIDPWSSPGSLQAPLRTLLKLHATVDTTTDIAECGIARCKSYLVTDPLTPFVSDWCRAYLRCLGRQEDGDLHDDDFSCSDIQYWSVGDEDRSNPWPQDGVREAGWDVVAVELGVTVSELKAHVKKLDEFTGSDPGKMPILHVAELKPKLDCVVDGEIYRSGSTSVADIKTKPFKEDGRGKTGGSGSNADSHCDDNTVRSSERSSTSTSKPNQGVRHSSVDSVPKQGSKTATHARGSGPKPAKQAGRKLDHHGVAGHHDKSRITSDHGKRGDRPADGRRRDGTEV